MKYHIDTIPVWDALKLDSECPLCALRRKTELGEAERYLGASVMEPDTRIQVNKLGFCPQHHAMLFGMSNRLGHALMLESHTAETRQRIRKTCDDLNKAAKAWAEAPLGKMSRAGRGASERLDQVTAEMTKEVSSCIMCDSIHENMERYLHTFFHLYQNDTEFRKRFSQSKGVCLPHLADLVRTGREELSPKEFAPFCELLTSLTNSNLDRIQEDVSWFIKKFDYRYSAEPWKNSQDAVPRTVNKLRGWCVGDEPNPKE
ncbi:MAG: ABC transporter substrate-binding protein [Clostridia bacterium]|nr:ABC transporter substrate-binding protein [Clostridia bacterium]